MISSKKMFSCWSEKISSKKMFSFWHDWCDEEIYPNIYPTITKDALKRCYWVSYISIIAHPLYAFTITEYLQSSFPNLTLLQNIWPRVVFVSLPILIVTLIMSLMNFANNKKLYLWAFTMSLSYQVSSWINVWPAVIKGDDYLLAIVNTANVAIVMLYLIFVSPPMKILTRITVIHFVMFHIPFFYVASFIRKLSIQKIIISDTIEIYVLSFALAALLSRLRAEHEQDRYYQKKQTALHTSDRVAEAIFENKDELLRSTYRKGFLVNHDIRGFAILKGFLDSRDPYQGANPEGKLVDIFLKKYGDFILHVRKKYHAERISDEGDGHMSFFGDSRYESDSNFKDVSDVEDDAKIAEFRIFWKHFQDVLEYVNEVTEYLYKLEKEFDIEWPVNIGFGVTFGSECFREVGGKYDLGADMPVRAARLQDYTKHFRVTHKHASVLVVDQEVFPFVSEESGLQLYDTNKGVRNAKDMEKGTYKLDKVMYLLYDRMDQNYKIPQHVATARILC